MPESCFVVEPEPQHQPEISGAEFPDYESLKLQAFEPERPGPGKYGDPGDDATWRHYVTERRAHAVKGSPAAGPAAPGDTTVDRALFMRRGDFVANQQNVRAHAYAHSFVHWRDELHAEAPEMIDDGQEPTMFGVIFEPGAYGPSRIGSSDAERNARLVVPRSKLERFEQTGGGCRLRPLASDSLRFPIFQPSRGRAETVRTARRARGRHSSD